jgi:phage nucleotide-binding protein
MLVYGNPGVGKTSLAATIKEKVLVVSAESGLLSLRGKSIDYVEIDGFSALREVREYLEKEETKKKYQWLFIDSITELGQKLVDLLKKKYPDRKDAMVMWGEYNDHITSLIKLYRDFKPYNIVMTALPSVDKDEVGRRFTGVDLYGKVSAKIPQFFDEVFYLKVTEKEDGFIERNLLTCEQNGIIAKDRSGKLQCLEPADLSVIYGKIFGDIKK